MSQKILCRFGFYDQILGETRPGGEIVLYSPIGSTATLAHENVHRSLLIGTTHGIFTQLVSTMYRFASDNERKQKKILRRMLRSLMSSCETLHEGCATAVEVSYVNRPLEEQLSDLPRRYFRAVKQFEPIIRAILEPLSKTGGNASLLNLVLDGLAKACMNNRILKVFPSAREFWDEWRLSSFLTSKENCPDKRLVILKNYIKHHDGFAKNVVSRLESANVFERMKLMSQLPTHIDRVRGEHSLSEEIVRICNDITHEVKLFPVDDSLLRDRNELMRQTEVLSSQLLEMIGVKLETPWRDLKVEDLKFPAVYIRHRNWGGYNKDHQPRAVAVVDQLREWFRQDARNNSKRGVVVVIKPKFNERHTERRLICEVWQVKIQPGEGEKVRIWDPTEEGDLRVLTCFSSVEELVELTKAIPEEHGIMAIHASMWLLLPKDNRPKLSTEARTLIFVYYPIVTVRQVQEWTKVQGATVPIHFVEGYAVHVDEEEELYRGVMIITEPAPGQQLARFTLLPTDHSRLLEDALSESGVETNNQNTRLSRNHVILAGWAAQKYFATEQFGEDVWLITGSWREV